VVAVSGAVAVKRADSQGIISDACARRTKPSISGSFKTMNVIRVLAIGVLAFSLAACSKPKQVKPESTPAPSTTESGTETSGIEGSQTPSETGAGTMSAAQQQALAALQGRNVVYFDYDSSEIRRADLEVVSANAAYLTKFKGTHVRLEGNTDERGSREYNIGLGERRAQAVRKALQLQGVTDAQIATVSYGEERPAVEGSDDSAYAKNRRVEIVQLP
jgi:peptidoglycan-associated lipoprotein